MGKPQKAVAVQPEAKLPADMSMFEQDAAIGANDVGSEDMMIPMLSILQQLSPQVNKRDGDYIYGAEASMIYNSATQALYDGETGIRVVPVKYERHYMEWKLRENGGGLVRDWGNDPSVLDGTMKNDKGQDVTKTGTQIVTTGTFYVLVVSDDGAIDRAIISFSSTQLKKARRWNTFINSVMLKGKNGMFTAPIFYKSYVLSTVPESNDKGNWFGWKITNSTPTVELPDGESIYLAARAFRELIDKGSVQKAAPPPAETDDEVPF